MSKIILIILAILAIPGVLAQVICDPAPTSRNGITLTDYVLDVSNVSLQAGARFHYSLRSENTTIGLDENFLKITVKNKTRVVYATEINAPFGESLELGQENDYQGSFSLTRLGTWYVSPVWKTSLGTASGGNCTFTIHPLPPTFRINITPEKPKLNELFFIRASATSRADTIRIYRNSQTIKECEDAVVCIANYTATKSGYYRFKATRTVDEETESTGTLLVEIDGELVKPKIHARVTPTQTLAGRNVSVTVSATDDTRVERIEIYSGGELIKHCFASNCFATITATYPKLLYTIKAYDIYGNDAETYGAVVVTQDNKVETVKTPQVDDEVVNERTEPTQETQTISGDAVTLSTQEPIPEQVKVARASTTPIYIASAILVGGIVCAAGITIILRRKGLL